MGRLLEGGQRFKAIPFSRFDFSRVWIASAGGGGVIGVKFTINEITFRCLFVSVTECLVLPCFRSVPVVYFAPAMRSLITWNEHACVNTRLPPVIANSFISKASCVAVCCRFKYRPRRSFVLRSHAHLFALYYIRSYRVSFDPLEKVFSSY